MVFVIHAMVRDEDLILYVFDGFHRSTKACSWFSMKHRLDCPTLVADHPSKEH